MKIKEWFKENVNLKREETEVRDNKGYAFTLGTLGLFAGAATGIIVMILQMVMGSASSSQTIVNIISTAIVIALLAYLIWLLLPMFKDSSISIGNKVLTTIVALVCLAIPFILGIYLIALAVMAIIAIAALWLGLKIWKPSSSSSSSEPDPDYFREMQV